MFDGIDWFWLPSLLKAAAFIGRRRPNVIILEWWSGTVLHSYLALCVLARMLGARVVIEFHEVLDTGEARIPLARIYAKVVGQAVIRLADGYAVHSEFDRALLRVHWRLGGRPVQILPHGPHDHYRKTGAEPRLATLRQAPAGVCNVLFFGVIRPYKGLEDLVAAFDLIPESEIDGYWLTIVGETWEGFTLPAARIAGSRYRDRITFVNRYVPDDELDAWLDGADAVALPYLRSSLSGPLHVAMGYGLPIIMTDVGGNAEAAAGYAGMRLVPPNDPPALLEAVRGLSELRGMRFEHPHSWVQTAEAYETLLEQLLDENATEEPSGSGGWPTAGDASKDKVA
jgi:glycosyltransferase involved in cell wall biosynthesis